MITKGAGGAFLPGGSQLTADQIAGGTVVSALIGGTVSDSLAVNLRIEPEQVPCSTC